MVDQIDANVLLKSPQMTALSEVFAAYRYEWTAFECEVWLNIVASVPEERFMAFLQHHFKTSAFAPKPADATKHLDVALSSERSFNRLADAVATVGPYGDPDIQDDILRQTVVLMGGWVSVNEQMPDKTEAHAMRAFRARFDANFNVAVSQVRVEQLASPEPLKSIGFVRDDDATRMNYPIPK